jgi:hypothetical protein
VSPDVESATEERAKIVAWLRRNGPSHCADAIEKKAHASGWAPPFDADEIGDLACPVCEDENVNVCRCSFEPHHGQILSAYCGSCHSPLVVTAFAAITFGDVRLDPPSK